MSQRAVARSLLVHFFQVSASLRLLPGDTFPLSQQVVNCVVSVSVAHSGELFFWHLSLAWRTETPRLLMEWATPAFQPVLASHPCLLLPSLREILKLKAYSPSRTIHRLGAPHAAVGVTLVRSEVPRCSLRRPVTWEYRMRLLPCLLK